MATSSSHGLPPGTTANVRISGTTNYDGIETVTYIDADHFYFYDSWVADDATGWWGIDTEGRYDVALGYYAGRATTTGSNNLFLGYQAGDNLTTGSSNIFIGSDIDAQSATGSSQLSIGNLIFGTGGFGTGTSVGTGNIGIGTAGPDRRLDVLDASNPQMRLTYTDGTVYTDFRTNSGGDLVITPSGGDISIVGNLLPSANDTYDLGSSSYRFKDAYLGGDTLHIGTSLTDEGTIGYNTSTNILAFGTDATTQGDIAFFTDDLYLDRSSGYVGIGDTSPASLFTVGNGDLFQINTSGQVVAGTWNGTAIGAQYGGTGLNTSSSTGIATVSSGTWSIASSIGVAQGGTGTTTQFTPGSVVFAGASGVYGQDNSNFFWDDSSNRLGIGTSSPVATLHVAGSSTVFGTGEGGTPADFTFRGAAGSGSNIAGGDIYFDASNGTGAGGSGDFIFRTAASIGGGGITFDATSTSYSSGTSSLSWSHTVGSNDSRLLIVGVSVGTTTNVSSVTYGGVSLTRLTYKDNGSQNRTELWYLKNPSSGAANIVVNMASSAMLTAGAISWYNVDQDTTFGTPVTASGSSQTPTVNVSSASDEVVVDAVAGHIDMSVGTMSVGSGQTQRWNRTQTESLMHGETAGGSSEPGASTTTMSWSLSAGGMSYSWSISAVSIKPISNTSGNDLAEAMRITNDGNVGIGTSSPTELLTVSNGSTTGTYTTSGWAHSSDERLKMNVTALGGALDTVSRLQGVSFNWKTNPTGDRQIGFIAQDVLGVLPEVVTGNEEEGYGIAYGNLTALLVEAVKELHTEQGTVAASLESRLDTLDLSTGKTATTLGGLQSSIDAQLDIVGDALSTLGKDADSLDGRLSALDSRVLSIESDITDLVSTTNGQDTRIGDLEEDMALLRDRNAVLFDFFQTFEMDRFVSTDAFGDVDLLGGRLSVGILQAETLCLEDVCVNRDQLEALLSGADPALASSEPETGEMPGDIAGASDESGAGATAGVSPEHTMDTQWAGDYLLVVDEGVADADGPAPYGIAYEVDLSGETPTAKTTITCSGTGDAAGLDRITTLRVFMSEGSWLTAVGGIDADPVFGSSGGKKYVEIRVRIPADTDREVTLEYDLPENFLSFPYTLKVEKQKDVASIPLALSMIDAAGRTYKELFDLDAVFIYPRE